MDRFSFFLRAPNAPATYVGIFLSCSVALNPLFSSGVKAATQQDSTVFDFDGCDPCGLTLDPVVSLGSIQDEAMLTFLSTASLDSHGHWIVSSTLPPRVVVYDSTGEVLRAFGRQGEGPGEFISVSQVVVGPYDSLFVFETTKVSVLSPDAGEYVRRFWLDQVPMGRVRFAPGGTMYHVTSAKREGRGSVLHLDRDGNLLGSFGGDEFVDQNGRVLLTPIAPTEDGLWISEMFEYAFVRQDRRDPGSQKISLDAIHFSGSPGRYLEGAPYKRPGPPLVKDISLDEEGRLWILSWVPDSEWQPVGADTPMEKVDGNDLWDSVVEVVDPKGGRVIATQRFDKAPYWFVGPSLISMHEEDELGVRRIEVWRASPQVEHPIGKGKRE